MRNSIVANFIIHPTGKKIHFCCHDILSGLNHDLWFPIFDEKSLFQEIEKIMISCRVAHNVTFIERIREGKNDGGSFEDYRITYNVCEAEITAKYVVKMIVSNVESLQSELVISRFTVETNNIIKTMMQLNWADVLAAKGKCLYNKLGEIYYIDEHGALLGHRGDEGKNIKDVCQFEIEWEKIEN